MFILGFKNPSLPVLRGRPAPPPPHPPRRDPAQSRRLHLPSSPLFFHLPHPAFPLPLGARLWGREREALCPPGGPALPRRPPGWEGRCAPRPCPLRRVCPRCARPTLPLPPIQPRARRRGGLCFEEESLSPKSGREVLALQTGSRKPLTHCSFSDCTQRRGWTCISTIISRALLVPISLPVRVVSLSPPPSRTSTDGETHFVNLRLK